MTVFHEVFLALAQEHPRADLLTVIADKARLLTGSASAAIALLTPDRDAVTMAAVSGPDADALLGTRIGVHDTVTGHTARTGEPHLAFHPGVRPDGDGTLGGARSAAVVPIFVGGRPVGALAALDKAHEKPFHGDDLMLLGTLAAAAAAQIGAADLRGAARRQTRELSRLYDAVQTVSRQITSQDVLRTVVAQAVAQIGGLVTVAFVANDDASHFYIGEESGLPAELADLTLPADGALAHIVLSGNRPVALEVVDDAGETLVPEDPNGPKRVENPFHAVDARAGLAAPIRNGDTIHGLLLILTRETHRTFTDADQRFLAAIAAQAAVGMDNALLYEDAQRRAEESATLYELSQAVSATLRLPEVLGRVARAVTSLLAVDKFALFLRDEDIPDQLRLVVARSLAEGATERLRPRIGQGIPGWVAEFETPTAVTDIAADHRNHSYPLQAEGVVSMLGMPLQIGVSTIGVLCAMTTRRRLFTVAEVELAYTIANQAAIAIENARIYADVRQKSLELRKYVHRVARALGSAQSPEEVPGLIAALARGVAGADRCALYRVTETGLELAAADGFRTADAESERADDDSPTVAVARRGKTLTIENLAADERFGRDRLPKPARGRIGAYLGVPLRRGETTIGVLEVVTRAPRRWTADETRLLLTFASQATVALENARLVEEGAAATREARLLRRLLPLMRRPRDERVAAVQAVLRDTFGTDDPTALPDGLHAAIDEALA